MKAQRRGLTPEQIKEKSGKIYRFLQKIETYQESETILFYLSAFREPDTFLWIKQAIEAGKKICVPVTDTQSHTIRLSYLNSMTDLKKGAYGILEPRIFRAADFSAPEFALVPGLAFSEDGKRVGFGQGYYDGFLNDTQAVKVGVCYEFQITNEIKKDIHDVDMNMIITEERVIHCDKI